jgi:VanZ family protein
MEGIQVFVRSRVPSASDAVAGTIGILAGWVVGVWRRNGLGPSDLLGLGAWWLWLLLVIWGPFPFIERQPHAVFDWMPGLPLESGNPLFTLEEILVKLVLFGLGGVLLGASESMGKLRTRMIAAAVLGIVVSGGLEATQMVFGSHSPSITDVILGGLGGCLGAVIYCRGALTE